MAKVANAAEFAEKWGRRTKAAVPDFVRGVQRTTVNPMQAAVAHQTPRGDFEANLNRMNTFVRHMHDMKGRT